ncbi:MAG: ATP-binding protein [Acholeplasmatales bacterium]|nr:ATP-binding protein [Acholeplasmatales bacterium]
MFYLFNNIKYKNILDLYNEALNDEKKYNDFIASITSFALENGLTGNLWHDYLIYILIFNDNPYTRALERNKNAKIIDLAKLDLNEFFRLYNSKEEFLNPIINFDFKGKVTQVSDVIEKIKSNINNKYDSFENAILSFYVERGLAFMSLYKAFRVLDGKLSPIYNVLDVRFDDLIGYDEQKALLKENTLNFLNGMPANNVLLYGDSGTGKSTSIKALLNEYFDKGLRIIEVYKHQMEEISKIIHTLESRPYFYIIYMDDLSFEEDEVEYKYLKSVIEGGIEPKPNNVLIYATSNRRHLIKENFSDNEDKHRRETEAEKLSLAYRFGLQIFYSSLSPDEFKKMVKELALRNDITVDDEILFKEANVWEMSYGSLSGRCATQFISYMINKYNKI